MDNSEIERSACRSAIATQDVTVITAMLHPEVRWYRVDGRARGLGSEAVSASARDRIASGLLDDAELTTWERVGDQLVIGVRLATEEPREQVFLCALAAGRIVKVHDCASRDDAFARLADE